MKISGIEGLVAAVGMDLGESEWCECRYEDILQFADATGDHQWLHVDRDRCERESPYKAPIAHGYFSIARIGGLFFQILDLEGFKGVVNYGLDKTRFPAPLLAGSQYRLKLKLESVDRIPTGAEGRFTATIEIEGNPKPACVAIVVYRFLE